MYRKIRLALLLMSAQPWACFAQTNPNLETYFKEYIGLSDEQISAIRGRQGLCKKSAFENGG